MTRPARTHEVLTYDAHSEAAPDVAWNLYARPGRWREWAPHIRGAWGLGDPEVQVGRRGLVKVLGAPLVPARITRKRAGRLWAWKVGPVELFHGVEPTEDGCRVRVEFDAPAPVERMIAISYGPLTQLLMRRLATVAARSRS